MESIGSYVVPVMHGGKQVLKCSKCGHVYCSIDENPKEQALVERKPLTEIGPHYYPTDIFEFRLFYCPECGVLFETEVADKKDPFLWDVKLKSTLNYNMVSEAYK